MTGTGFDAKNPSTWTYKGMDEVNFDMWNDRTVTTNNAMSYQQAKAYKVQSAPNPPDRSDLIDGSSSCDGQAGRTTSCKFVDNDDGIYEIWVTTDYAENTLDQLSPIRFPLDIPKLPPGVEQPPFPPPLETPPVPSVPSYGN